jgi:hypothetical protein
VPSKHLKDASLILSANVRLDDETIGQLTAAAADEASGNVLQSNVRITHSRPRVIELGVFRASILGSQDIDFQLSTDPNPDGSTTVEVKTTSHRWGQQTFLMIHTGPKYLRGKASYVRFLTVLAAKLSTADPAATVSQYRTVA